MQSCIASRAQAQHESAATRGKGRQRALAVLVGAIAACGGPVVQAEELKLDEIIVTAQKREQSLQDVPLAVSALSGAALRRCRHPEHERPLAAGAGAARCSRAPVRQRRTSASAASATSATSRPSSPPWACSSTVPSARAPVFGASELFDIERVEILRGPQSTLYGKNTTAGVIGIYSARRPRTS